MTTDSIELPPLPERYAVLPALVLPEEHGMGPNTTVIEQTDAFTADQMREYARAAVLAERERCVSAADAFRVASPNNWNEVGQTQTAKLIAAAIRTPPPPHR